MRNEEWGDLDLLLDSALSSYSRQEPRPGLDARVLHRLHAEGSAPRLAFPRWAWALSTLACVLTLTGWIWVRQAANVSAFVHSSILLEWCEQLQGTWFSTAIRESTLVFPIIEGSHILGLALMMAPAMMFDLRLMGMLWKRDPVSKVKAKFLPVTFAGFALMVTTGSLLFSSEPVKCFNSGYFRVKLLLIAIAGLNALVFHSTIDRRLTDWDTMLPTPPRARLAGIFSLAIWTGVIIAGRYTAYSAF